MSKSPTATDAMKTLREEAWIGDAVLELYARSKVLAERGQQDIAMKTRFTWNQFLSGVGEPTKVEAEIGRSYQAGGLEAGFSWIREHLEPLFHKQEAKRLRVGQKK